MALKKTLNISAFITMNGDGWATRKQYEDNVSFADAYIKVESVNGGKSGAFCTVTASDGVKTISKSYEFTPSMDGKNFIAQAYEYLKTLPEFAGAQDC